MPQVGFGRVGWGRVRGLVVWGQDRSDRSGQVGLGGVRMSWVGWILFGGVWSRPTGWVRFSPIRWVGFGWFRSGPTGVVESGRVGSHPTGWVMSDGYNLFTHTTDYSYNCPLIQLFTHTVAY